jgi:hypothetical protein
MVLDLSAEIVYDIVMRAISHTRDTQVPSEGERVSESGSDSARSAPDSVSFIGKTVASAREHLEKIYRAPLGTLAFVDGKKVPEDFVLMAGQILEFSDEEEEDWAAEMHRSPEFWEMIHARRREEGISWEDAERQLGLDS